jgi:YHS domain-containing protein
MKPFIIIAVVSALLAAGTITYTHSSANAAEPTTQPAATQPAGKPINKICPVEKEEIDPDGPTVVYQGKVIGFCCKSCVKKFNANPEKYMKDLK